MKVDAGRAAFIVLCVVLFSGCALFSPVKTDTKQYALNRKPNDKNSHRPVEQDRDRAKVVFSVPNRRHRPCSPIKDRASGRLLTTRAKRSAGHSYSSVPIRRRTGTATPACACPCCGRGSCGRQPQRRSRACLAVRRCRLDNARQDNQYGRHGNRPADPGRDLGERH